MKSPRRLCVSVALAAVIVVATASSAAARTNRAVAHGTLIVSVVGLPSGTNAHGFITGPSGFKRRLLSSGTLRIASVRPGRYTVRLSRVTISRPLGTIHAGAIATPAIPRVSAEVRAAKSTRAQVAYGTIVNPNVAQLVVAPARVLGEADHPTGLILKGVKPPRVGSFLTSGPSATLPLGLVARVAGVKAMGATTTVSVASAAISEVAPEVNYAGAIAFHELSSAVASSAPACGAGSGLALTGGMKVTGIGLSGLEGSIWPSPRLAFRTTVGIAGTAGWSSSASASCEASHTLATWTGVIPGLEIPVFAQPKLALDGSVTAATTNGFEARTTLVTKFDSRPANVSLGLTGSSAALTGTHSGISAEVSLGLYMEVGIGVPDIDSIPIALNIHATLGAALAFTAEPSNPTPDDRCLVHAKLGSLEVGITGGPFSLSLGGFSGLDQRIAGFNCGPPSAGGGASGGGGGSGGGSGGGGAGGSGPSGEGGGSTGTGTASAISASSLDTCALLPTGGVDCWGFNFGGQLASGTGGTSSDVPVPAEQITNASAMSVGASHACALLVTGEVDCWGEDRQGDIGDGSTGGDIYSPVAVSGLSNATAISAGLDHTCALLSTTSADCWGSNAQGQLGGSSQTESSVPLPVSGISNATAIATGAQDTCALLANGTIDCWGYNEYGELGNSTTGQASTPVAVKGISDATAIAVGAYHTCALLVGGSVACWGENGFGQLGDGTTTDSDVPVMVSGITNATAISAGESDTCAVLAGGAACWGSNHFGQLGDGTTTDSDVPVMVSGITNAKAVTSGGSHACALLSTGSVDCWGWNEFGQLGNGSTTNSDTPVAVIGFP